MCCGRYWVRTSDLFGVNEARYHCANRPGVPGSRDRLAHPAVKAEGDARRRRYPGAVTFSHDTEQSLLAVVDLVNTDPQVGGTEGLRDLGILREFVASHQISGAEDLAE